MGMLLASTVPLGPTLAIEWATIATLTRAPLR